MPVYNLTVAGEQEYFANGILVHNCSWMPGERSPDRLDALVWAATDLMVGDPTYIAAHAVSAPRLLPPGFRPY